MMGLFDDFENVSVTNEWNFVNKEWTFLTILTTNFVVFLTERGAPGSLNKLQLVYVFDTGHSAGDHLRKTDFIYM